MKLHHIYDLDLNFYSVMNKNSKREALLAFVLSKDPEFFGEWWEDNIDEAPKWHNKHYKKIQDDEDYLWNNENNLFEEWAKEISDKYIISEIDAANYMYKTSKEVIKE